MKNDIDLEELVLDMKMSYHEMAPYREKLLKFARESAGGNYGENGEESPVNLLSLYERTMMGYLVGGEPRMMISTTDRSLKSMSGTFEDECNRGLKAMGFRDILRRAVRDSLYQMAIVKVAITAPAESRFRGYGFGPGSAGIYGIDFEDYVCDMRAKKFSECSYVGHRYCVLYDDVKDSKLYDKKAVRKIVPKTDDVVNMDGSGRLSSIGRGSIGLSSFEEYFVVWELCLPRWNKVITFDADGDYKEPLLVQDWIGPKCGPYHYLFHGEVLGNLLPKGPFMDLLNLHTEENMHWMHLNLQATKQKSVVIYQNAEDAERMKAAVEGEYVQSNVPDAVREVMIHSGPNPNVSNWVGMVNDYFNEHSGNIRELGGLGSSAGTATEAKLIHSSASVLVNSMGQRVHQFVQEVMEAYAWFRWNNLHETMSSSFALPGTPEFRIDRKLTPMDRYGKSIEDFDIQFDPYSLVSHTPQSKLVVIQNMMEKYIIPLLPLFNQPGVGAMLETYVRQVAKLTNCPELIDLLEKLIGVRGPLESPGPQQGEASPAMMMPQQRETVHTRVSKPGMSDQANRQMLQQLMAGGQPPPGAGAGGLGQMGRAK